MFFNEDLYLEGDDVAQATDEEISDAVEESGGLGAVSEDYNFYEAGLEFLNESNEYYYNLREKMMNIEHIAGIKAAQGLVSESQVILSEAADAFLDKVKNVFEKIKNFVINMFNKFVNFVSSLFVSTKSVLNMDVDKAFDATRSKNYELKVRVLNVDPAQMEALPGEIQNLLTDLENHISDLARTAKAFRGVNEQMENKIKNYKKETESKLLARRKAMKGNVALAIAMYALPLDNNTSASGVTIETVLQRKEKVIDKKEFIARIKYAKDFKDHITDVKKAKETCIRSCNESIKSVKEAKSESNDDKRRELLTAAISHMRWYCAREQAAISKLISVMSQYYRECIAIGKRILGANRAQEGKTKLKKLGEGFDYYRYFA